VTDNFCIHEKLQSRTKYIDTTPKQVLVNFSVVSWRYKGKDNEHKTCKMNCFIVPPPPTIPPHFKVTYMHTSHTYIHTLKLTRWLPRHTTRRLLSTTLRATSEGSTTKVGLAIADKSGLTRWQEKMECTPLESITVSTRGKSLWCTA
jgi:hypothetical protein